MSGTMVVAHKVGIPIFVTGGIGGVHRGAENTMDISADLTELGRTPVTVVSAGVKSILDVGRTLEYLETQGKRHIVMVHIGFQLMFAQTCFGITTNAGAIYCILGILFFLIRQLYCLCHIYHAFFLHKSSTSI